MGPGGSQTSTQNQTQDSTTRPWQEGMPLLMNLIGRYGGMDPSMTSDQSGALKSLMDAGKALPGMDPSSLYAPVTGGMGFNTGDEQSQLHNLPGMLSGYLSKTLDPNNLDPNNTPGFSDSMRTMTNDITNNTKGVFSGSGRDPSGAGSFAQSLGRGLMQGEAPIMQSQFNANRGAQTAAAEALSGLSDTTAMQEAGLKSSDLSARLGSLGYLPQAMQDSLMGPQANLQFANTGYGLPFQNLQDLLGPSMALGSMGSMSHGTGNSQGTTQQSSDPFGNIMGGAIGGLGLLSKFGVFSDIRMKDDVEEIGKLHDGQKVVRFRYKGQPKTQIGVIAQDVAKTDPDAVGMLHGMLVVDQKRATDRAAAMAQ